MTEPASSTIDTLLDQASAIVARLIEEIGPLDAEPPAEQKPPQPAEQPAAHTQGDLPEQAAEPAPPAADGPLLADTPIDDQLETVEGLLDETDAQLSGPPDEPKPATTTEAPHAPASHPTTGVPEAGDEAPPLGDEAPSIDGAGLLPDGGLLDECDDGASLPPLPDTPWRRAIVIGADALCTALDRIDRPFARVSYATRQILGLCALGTLLTALATLIVSHL